MSNAKPVRDAIDADIESIRLLPSEVMAILRHEMTSMGAARKAAEDRRSQLRNRNRLLVLVCGIVCSFSWPVLVAVMTHTPISAGAMLASFGATLGFTGDLLVTAYAYFRRY